MPQYAPLSDSSASAVGQPAKVRRQQGGRHATGHGFAIDVGLLARMLRLEVGVGVLIIVAGILLVVLNANPSSSIVSDVHGWARSLAHPFDGMLSFRNAHVAIAVNWGIAAVAYVLLGALIGRLPSAIRRWRALERSFSIHAIRRTHDRQEHR